MKAALKIMLPAILSILFVCCSESTNKPKDEQNPTEVKYLKVEEAILNFIKAHPNWNQNDIVQEKTFDTLTKELNPLIDEGLYDDLPFKFEDVQEVVENGKKSYLVLFNFDNNKFEDNRLAKAFILSVYGVVDETMLDTLKQGNSYFINGKVLKFKTDKFSVIKKNATDNSIEMVELPNVRMKITKVTPVKLL